MTEINHVCPNGVAIKPTSSSMVRAPSWSLGFGADMRDCETNHGTNCCPAPSQPLEAANEPLSSSLPSSSSQLSGQHCCSRSITSATPTTLPPNNCPQIDIEIPTVYLHRKSPSSPSFHVYQINVKTSTSIQWSIYRRYSEFLSLHKSLRAKEPAIGKFAFPPKRRLNSKTSTIVQERRRKLECYLRLVSKHVVQMPLGSADSGSYQKLHDLASNGPAPGALSRECSLHDGNTLSDSARSETQDDNQIIVIEEDSCGQLENGGGAPEFLIGEPTTSEQQADLARLAPHSNEAESRSLSADIALTGGPQAKAIGVRQLFCEFISPAEGERGQLESGT